MASSEQLIALFESFGAHDESRFYKTALQIAAEASRRGNKNVARDMRDTIDDIRSKRAVVPPRSRGPVPLQQPLGELSELLTVSYPEVRFGQMILDPHLEKSMQRVLREHYKSDKLQAFDLSPRRKLLLHGPPGTGKTMTARALAGELRLPLFLVRLEGVITRFMGETATKLRLVFDTMYEKKGVYLFDEFDALAAHRATDNDVGEVRRVLNSLLQFIEADSSQSIIVAATNHVALIDRALFRRFDDIVDYALPDREHLKLAFQEFLSPFEKENFLDWDELAKMAQSFSYAEVRRVCEDAAKEMILTDDTEIKFAYLIAALEERKISQT